jgi:hypothetical protein
MVENTFVFNEKDGYLAEKKPFRDVETAFV